MRVFKAENYERRRTMDIIWTKEEKNRRREQKWKEEIGWRKHSVSCGHGPSGRTIFYRIYLSRVLSSMKESLAWKFLALLINGWRDKLRSKRIDRGLATLRIFFVWFCCGKSQGVELLKVESLPLRWPQCMQGLLLRRFSYSRIRVLYTWCGIL